MPLERDPLRRANHFDVARRIAPTLPTLKPHVAPNIHANTTKTDNDAFDQIACIFNLVEATLQTTTQDESLVLERTLKQFSLKSPESNANRAITRSTEYLSGIFLSNLVVSWNFQTTC